MQSLDRHLPPALCGWNTVPGVVAIEQVGTSVRVFSRTGQGVTFRDHPFKPFFLLADPTVLDSGPIIATDRHRLAGSGVLCWLIEVTSWYDWRLLRDYLQQTARPELWFGIADSSQQFLIASGIRFFQGMAPADLTVLCISIATGDEGQQRSRSVPFQQGPITALAVSDTKGCEEIISCTGITEREMLERLSDIIRDKDPDVITGLRLTRADFPCIIRRARHHGVRLEWGRDGSEPYLLMGAEKHRRQKAYSIFGRSVVDTLAMLHQYEQQVHPLPGTRISEIASWFGCAPVPADGSMPVCADVRETGALYQLLAPLWFQKTQLYPISYQSAVTRPGAAAVKSLLIQEYLRNRHALPAPLAKRLPSGQGGGELFRSGLASPVVSCDLSTLPASVMLAYRIAPKDDELGIFLPLLRSIQHYCMQQQAVHTLPLQTVLLPGWHELLAHGAYPFSDLAAAGEVQRLVRVILADLLGWLREQGAEPVWADPQAVYFEPAAGHTGEDEITALMQRLTAMLPHSADLRCNGQYQAMFVYSQSNFALLKPHKGVVYRGNSFSNRSLEPFLRDFLKESLVLLLGGQPEKIRTLYAGYLRRLVSHDCPVDWLVRTEALADTTENYQQAVQEGKRNRSAVYELALSVPNAWQIGDTISYYVTGSSKQSAVHENCRFVTDFDPTRPDLNSPWYTERLHQFFKKLEPFLPAEPTLF